MHLCRLYSTAGFTIDYLKHVIDVEKAKDVEAYNPLVKRFARVIAKNFDIIELYTVAILFTLSNITVFLLVFQL
ncbi:MAG: hypothetical protein LM583_05070 [Desulfurococcaceae archaeon]|nr:hypothetical protein [Desulfurococcaceae archaeon]